MICYNKLNITQSKLQFKNIFVMKSNDLRTEGKYMWDTQLVNHIHSDRLKICGYCKKQSKNIIING